MTPEEAREIVFHDARKAGIGRDDNNAHSRWWKRAHDIEKKFKANSFFDVAVRAKGFLEGLAYAEERAKVLVDAVETTQLILNAAGLTGKGWGLHLGYLDNCLKTYKGTNDGEEK